MRISDWSADVCSSDLRDRLRTALMTLRPEQRAALVLRFYEDLSEADPAEALGMPLGTEIGRASCRERVCQYVQPSVAPVPLIKQTTSLTPTIYLLIFTYLTSISLTPSPPYLST